VWTCQIYIDFYFLLNEVPTYLCGHVYYARIDQGIE
jgi:hypothetical protein